MAGYVPHIHAGGMIQNMADDKFLLRPAQEDDGMMESGAIQVGGGNQKVPARFSLLISSCSIMAINLRYQM